jgi:hypothetical protein
VQQLAVMANFHPCKLSIKLRILGFRLAAAHFIENIFIFEFTRLGPILEHVLET